MPRYLQNSYKIATMSRKSDSALIYLLVLFQILKNNVVQHDATAREWTAKYAM